MNERRGIISGSIAYFFWGILPLYWKLLSAVPAQEIILHRIIWSAVSLIVVIIVIGRFRQLRASLANTNNIRLYFTSACLIGFNWFLYIYAVLTNQTIEASLGYYICPLLVVLLASVFFGDRITKSSSVAIFLAIIAVLYQVIHLGKIPFIALALSSSFAIYGLIRKYGKLDPILGLAVETIC